MKLQEFVSVLSQHFPDQVRLMTPFDGLPSLVQTEDIRLVVKRGNNSNILFLYFYTESIELNDSLFIYLPARINFPFLMQFLSTLDIEIKFRSPDDL